MQFDNPPAGREVTGRCQMWLSFLPTAITDNQIPWCFLTTYKHCARNWLWHGPGKAGKHSLLFKAGRPWDHGQRSTWGWHCCETGVMGVPQQLSGNGCSNGTDSTQMLQGQFEYLLESPVDWTNSIAQVLERWKFKVRPYPSPATNDLWFVTIFVLPLCIMRWGHGPWLKLLCNKIIQIINNNELSFIMCLALLKIPCEQFPWVPCEQSVRIFIILMQFENVVQMTL